MSKTTPVPPPDKPNLPMWFSDQKARREKDNWDQEGKLRGQEETNQLWWLRAYGALVILLLLILAEIGVDLVV